VGGVWLDVLANAADVGVEAVAVVGYCQAPELSGEFGAGDECALGAYQDDEDVELGRGEGQGGVVPEGLPSRDVDAQRSPRDQLGLVRGWNQPAVDQQGEAAEAEHAGVEVIGDLVVGGEAGG